MEQKFKYNVWNYFLMPISRLPAYFLACFHIASQVAVHRNCEETNFLVQPETAAA
jgi:hypothetical protein